MLKLNHVIEAQQFDRELINEIFVTAREMEDVVQHYGSNILTRRVMGTLFYEPSTRTRLSFESAMRRLGGEVLTTENAQQFSSVESTATLFSLWAMVESLSSAATMPLLLATHA